MKNLPNQITVSRIILVFVFVVLSGLDDKNPFAIHVSADTAYICHVIALIVAVIAGLTDLVDGYLARKFKVESDFGRLIDPLADKIFVLATYTMMVSYALIPGWFLIIILAREFIVTGLRTLASAKGVVIAVDRWGKLKTALQMLFLVMGGLSWINFFGFSVEAPGVRIIWWIFMGIVALITVSSGLGYFIKYRKLYMESL